MSVKIATQTKVLSPARQKMADYGMLFKFRLNMLVIFSAAMAYLIAVGGAMDWTTLILLCVGGFLVTAASNTLNQVLERETDQLMKRTADRPLAAGRMSVSEAVMIAGFTSLIGITLLAAINPWTALLGTVSFILYAFVYTPMKKVSPIAVFIGAIPVKPPEINIETNPILNKQADVNLMLPPYNVAIQLNTFTADGTAIINVKTTKKLEINGFTPDINMWCAHTMNDKNAIANME